ncbi:hypothetical protein [Marinobacter sp. SS8-8]|uniref:hypothetical protein n=1 Tax=Marinobacter sp. SS8-8 TaxID=3050452 RepID=UPI0026E00968|nr:hypothetical protein [Marinobacter sp. SS8-8]
MRLPIRYNGNYIVEFDQLKVHGREAAGGYGLTFVMRGNRLPCHSQMMLFDITLSIALADPLRPLVTSVPSSTRIIRCHSFSSSEQIDFEMVLSGSQVNSLEEYREENDLKLNLGLRALVTSDDELTSSFDCTDITVPREQWLDALRNAEYRNTLLFEVPLPNASGDLKALFSKAQEFIEIGHYKDAVMQCRHIVEQVEALREDKQASAAANRKAHSSDRKDMSSIERLMSLREQLKNICQLGAHGNEEFTRSQARAVLGMTMALLAEPTVGFVSGQECTEEQY